MMHYCGIMWTESDCWQVVFGTFDRLCLQYYTCTHIYFFSNNMWWITEFLSDRLCDMELSLCSVSVCVGWMSFPPARTPWAPSHPQTSTAWRSSSSTTTSTTAGTWRQRPTGTMRTAQRVFSSARASKLSQVGLGSDTAVAAASQHPRSSHH